MQGNPLMGKSRKNFTVLLYHVHTLFIALAVTDSNLLHSISELMVKKVFQTYRRFTGSQDLASGCFSGKYPDDLYV